MKKSIKKSLAMAMSLILVLGTVAVGISGILGMTGMTASAGTTGSTSDSGSTQSSSNNSSNSSDDTDSEIPDTGSGRVSMMTITAAFAIYIAAAVIILIGLKKRKIFSRSK